MRARESEVETLMEQYRQPAIMLHRPYPPVQLPQTGSYLGGLPQLPPDFDWPRTSDGTPLHFLAQIDCSEMPLVDLLLPKEGVLFFFARMDEEMIWGEGNPQDDCRVLYASETADTAKAVPEDLPSIEGGWSRFEKHFVLSDDETFNVYPRWPVVAHLIQAWPDWSALSDNPEEEIEGYQDAVCRARAAEVLRTTGVPPLWPLWLMSVMDELSDEKQFSSAVTSGREHPFPQAWVLIDRTARWLANWSKRTRFEDSKYFDDEELQRIYQAAMEWVQVASERDLGDVVASEERAVFAKWLLTLNDASSIHIQNRISEALQDAIESAIIYAARSSQLAASLPPRYYSAFEHRHAPVSLSSHGSLEGWRMEPRYHQMLGNAGSVQSAQPAERDEVLLLQLASDYGVDFMFCDCGEATFWIDKKDLVAKRFDRVRASTCGG